MSQTGYTPIQLYYSSTTSNTPTAGNLLPGELAINTADGKLFYEDSSGNVQVLATKAGASGDVVGPASATDGNLAAFDGATGKLIKQAATVTAAQGGTGQSSYAVGDLLYASTTSALSKLADVATGNALISGGVGVAPSWGKIGLTTHVSGTLAATSGGTGQSSYAVGDLLYASTTSALSKLADVATGNALISGGVGVAPSWGKITLTTHVSGTLPVANGGTGVTSSTGSGAVVLGTSPTLSGPTINDGYTEEVYAIPSSTTPALSPTNGSIQTWTLTGNSTPTAGTWAAGQSLTLMVDDGTAYTITWTSLAVTWKTDAGSAPTLNTTGYTVIQLWKVGATIYGARVGDA